MKHIFVTIEEFLSNGGQLTPDREIFSVVKNTKNDFQLIGYYVCKNGDYHIIQTGSAAHPAAIMAHYVRIDVTPVWK